MCCIDSKLQSPNFTPVEGIEPPNIRFAGEGINLSATPAHYLSACWSAELNCVESKPFSLKGHDIFVLSVLLLFMHEPGWYYHVQVHCSESELAYKSWAYDYKY